MDVEKSGGHMTAGNVDYSLGSHVASTFLQALCVISGVGLF